MPKGPRGERRPADVIGAGVIVAMIATGEIADVRAAPESRCKDFAAVALSRQGGTAKKPNRFRGLYGATRATELLSDQAKARSFYARLIEIVAETDRLELEHAHAYLANN